MIKKDIFDPSILLETRRNFDKLLIERILRLEKRVEIILLIITAQLGAIIYSIKDLRELLPIVELIIKHVAGT